jgi:hypothetical protein
MPDFKEHTVYALGFDTVLGIDGIASGVNLFNGVCPRLAYRIECSC